MGEYKCIAFLHNEINEEHRNYKNQFGWGHDCGYANGYVAIPPEHPLHGRGYDDFYVDIHGGLTYAASAAIVKTHFNPNFLELCFLDDIPDDYWVFGFDTMHYLDTLDYWSRENVIKEVDKLEKFFTNYVENSDE